MHVAWHPDRWWDWCMLEDEKKEIDAMFIEGLYQCVWVLKHFLEEWMTSILLEGIRTF